MATVRITNDIRYHVRNKFDALYRERIERKQKELQNLDIGNVCYLHYVPAKYRELAQQLNADGDGEWLGNALLPHLGERRRAKMIEALEAVSQLADARKPKEK